MPDSRVLAIGLDSAEAALIRRLLDEGRLPALQGILDRGKWTDLVSNASLGSASVWPSFMTGLEPVHHGIYNEWAWDAPTMSARRPRVEALTPFWKELVEEGVTVGLLDVPFAPFLGIERGFELSEWGAHDRMTGRLRVSPDRLGPLIDRHPDHPYRGEPERTDDFTDTEGLRRIATAALRGISSRGRLARDLMLGAEPDLAVIVFPELHDAGHFLWHGIEPHHPTFEGQGFDRLEIQPSLVDLHIAVDQEIGHLMETVPPDTSVVVFALHGMRSGVGWPRIADLLLERAGLMHPATWRSRRARENVVAALAALKRRAPKPLKDLYHRKAGTSVQIKMAQPTMIGMHDWQRTEAFPVMDDHAGFLRVNLAGRERDGIVPPDEYEEVRKRVVALAEALITDDGERLVEEIVQPEGVTPLELELPDMIVHWTDEAFKARPSTVEGRALPEAMFRVRTGRHEASGFCVASGPAAGLLGPTVRTERLHRALVEPLRA